MAAATPHREEGEAVVLVERTETGRQWRVRRCEWCGEKHVYGRPDEGVPGHRVNHCRDPKAPTSILLVEEVGR
ncbi:MAG: hypothetical protein M3Q10_06160 [Chloroflexota bacterium]|nr:hypothetical protein [Chloroflexota bacterium]